MGAPLDHERLLARQLADSCGLAVRRLEEHSMNCECVRIGEVLVELNDEVVEALLGQQTGVQDSIAEPA